MTEPVVDLHNVISELETQGNEMNSYLNRQTGELVTVSNEYLGIAETEEEIADRANWEQEEIRKAGEILDSADYLRLPSQFDIHEWSIMREFCDEVEDSRLRQALLENVHGRGAFRHFKDTLLRNGIENRWYEYRYAALGKIAKEWLEENEIPYRVGEKPEWLKKIEAKQPKKKKVEAASNRIELISME